MAGQERAVGPVGFVGAQQPGSGLGFAHAHDGHAGEAGVVDGADQADFGPGVAIVVGVAIADRGVFVEAAPGGVEGPDGLRAETVDASFGNAVSGAGREWDEAVEVVVDVDGPRRPMPGCALVA